MDFTEDAVSDAGLLPVQGHVQVDLVDERGRVVQREESDNFLSLQSLAVAKWWQRMMWGAYNPVEVADVLGSPPSEMPWFPAQHLAYWNDSSAESPSTEDSIASDIVGWASRLPVGSPSGKRGVVNITESAFSDSSSKWVFDWTTSQGNGTFQSVGWTRIAETSGYPQGRWPETDACVVTVGGVSGPAPGCWWDSTNSVFNIIEAASSSQYRVASVPVTGGATTAVTTLPTGDWSVYTPYGVARIGTDVILCGGQGASNSQISRHTVAGVKTWAVTAGLTTTIFYDCTVDGSGVIWTAGRDGNVRSHNPSSGAITATVTPTLAPTSLTGIAYDPGDGNFWVRGNMAGIGEQVWKINSSGASVVAPVSLYQVATSVTSTAPYAGTYQIPPSGAREPYYLQSWQNTGTGSTAIGRNQTANFGFSFNYGMTMKGTELWLARQKSGVGAGAAIISALRGGTLGTRTKLSSAVTKTSAQTLKITYTFNFS